MKKFIKKGFIILFLLSSTSFAHSIEINLKISGGLSYLKLEDVNRSLTDWAERWKKESLFKENWSYKGGEVKKFHTGFDFDGEIIISFTPHLAAGIGAGYIYGELIEEKTELTVEKSDATYIYARPTKVSAFPLTLSAYYFYPLGKRLNLFIKGGMGLIWAKYIERKGFRELLEEKFKYYEPQRASAQGPAFHGSVGIIYSIDPSVRFFVEGGARLARIGGFHGEADGGEKGDLFFFEEYDSDLEYWQAKFKVLAEEPSGGNFRSVQKAIIDFSGFSAKIGLLIKF